jgi:hypothetical protein
MRHVILSVALAVSLAAHAAPKNAPKATPCTVPASLLDIYSNLENVTAAEWNAARTTARGVIKACTAAAPKDPASRALLFSLLKQEMLVHYDPLLVTWQKRGDDYTMESTSEGILSFQRELLEMMDRMVSPQDMAHANIILEYANGLAISKLGREIKEQVLLQSGGRARFIYGLVLHNRQEENFRAIGYWLDPADKTLTAAEKSQFALTIAGALPRDGVINNEAHARFVTTIITALGNSSDPKVEEKLRAWQGMHEGAAGSDSSIADLAGQAADTIKKRVARK